MEMLQWQMALQGEGKKVKGRHKTHILSGKQPEMQRVARSQSIWATVISPKEHRSRFPTPELTEVASPAEFDLNSARLLLNLSPPKLLR